QLGVPSDHVRGVGLVLSAGSAFLAWAGVGCCGIFVLGHHHVGTRFFGGPIIGWGAVQGTWREIQGPGVVCAEIFVGGLTIGAGSVAVYHRVDLCFSRLPG